MAKINNVKVYAANITKEVEYELLTPGQKKAKGKIAQCRRQMGLAMTLEELDYLLKRAERIHMAAFGEPLGDNEAIKRTYRDVAEEIKERPYFKAGITPQPLINIYGDNNTVTVNINR